MHVRTACPYCMPRPSPTSVHAAWSLGAGEALLPAPSLDSGGSAAPDSTQDRLDSSSRAAPDSSQDRLDSSSSAAPKSSQDRLVEGVALASDARQAGVVTAVGESEKQKNSRIGLVADMPGSFKDEPLGSAAAAAAASEPESEFQGGGLNVTVEQQIESAVRDREVADASRVRPPLQILPSSHCFCSKQCIFCRQSGCCFSLQCCCGCHWHAGDLVGKTPLRSPTQRFLPVAGAI